MKLLIITHVPHIKVNHEYFGYAPYVREMNIWLRYVDEVVVVAPLVQESLTPIHESYVTNSPFRFVKVPEFDLTSFFNQLKAFPRALVAMVKMYQAMQQASHIHLRCPGNMGLVGAIVQILFPYKQKTAKYAGNWDPKSKQPWSYRLQQWILSNTFLTKNMQVLVYGEWPNQTKNVKPFFTATYGVDEIQNSEFRIQNKWSLPAQSKTTENNFDSAQSDREDNHSLSLRVKSRTTESGLDSARLDKIEIDLPPTSFLFVGTLSKGKQPLYAIQLVEKLYQHGKKVRLNLYGDGILRPTLETYIKQNSLQDIVFLRGNQSKETVLKAYQSSHFLILPSKSEGWPKVVAEAMFWGCVPIASPVSCVSYMMGNGRRGVILQEELNQDVDQIEAVISKQEVYQKMASEGQTWSRQFTTDKFEAEIKKLLRG